MRSKPYARPYASAGTTSARIALRLGPRIPRAAQAPVRSTDDLPWRGGETDAAGEHRGRHVAADGDLRAAVRDRRPARRRRAWLHRPRRRRRLRSTPSADAGAPRVTVRKLGSSAVGISCPYIGQEARRAPIHRTPGLNQVVGVGGAGSRGRYSRGLSMRPDRPATLGAWPNRSSPMTSRHPAELVLPGMRPAAPRSRAQRAGPRGLVLEHRSHPSHSRLPGERHPRRWLRAVAPPHVARREPRRSAAPRGRLRGPARLHVFRARP